MATQSVILPGKSHGQRSLGGLQSMELQGIRQDLVTKRQQSQIKGKAISLKEMKKQSLHFSSLVSFSPSHPLPCRGVRVDYVAFLVVLVVKNPPANAGNLRDMGLIPGSGRYLGGGNDNPFKYSCLESSMDSRAWWATYSPWGCKESDTTQQLLQLGNNKTIDSESEVTQSSTLRPHGLQPTRLLHPQDFPGKNTGMGCHFLLREIFPTQRLNPSLLHCRQILNLSHLGSP